MSGMLSRASGNSSPLLNIQVVKSKTQAPVQAAKRHCKSSGWQQQNVRVGVDQYIVSGEPTSVLDIRSPSPTSTLSSSVGGSSESGAVAAVSGLFCEAVSDGSNAPPPPPPIPTAPQGQQWYSGSKGNASSGGKSGECSSWRLSNGGDEEEGHQGRAEEWASALQALQGGATVTTSGMEDLESIMLLESAAAPAPDQSLWWLLGESDDPKDIPTASSLPQINSMDSSFPDPGGFAFSTSNFESIPALPTTFNPQAYSTLPPPLPRHQFSENAAPPLSYPAFQPQIPEPPPPLLPQGFSASNSLLFASNAFSKDPAINANNNVFFPVSYEMPVPKRLHGGLLPVEHLPLPLPLPLRPPPLWQQQHQGSIPVKQEFMFKPQQQQQQQQQHHADLLQSLQRRHLQQQQQQQQQLFQPQFQRPKGGAASGFIKAGSEEVQQTMVGHLLKAAEAVEQGTFTQAQAILARLNQHLSPLGKPLHRAAFYFKEALTSRILNYPNDTNNSGLPSSAPPPLSPVDIVHKISAYKCFSEVSPLAQFANFTANQALLEALEGEDAIHIIDFEIGLGGQWASFLQELALKLGGPPSLRLTALGARGSVEMHLARENLAHFAKELNINFEFNVLELEGFETLTIPMLHLRDQEAVAVNMSLGMHRLFSSFPSPDSIAGLLKEISPKAVVVLDAETCPSSSSFVQQFVEALQFYSFLFDSLDAVVVNNNNMDAVHMDAVHKIEKFLLAPKIESLVVSGSIPAKVAAPPWRSVFLAAGLVPVAFSNFTETQAEYLIGRLPGRGFEVIKDQATLLLGWQGRPLVSASLWRCC